MAGNSKLTAVQTFLIQTALSAVVMAAGMYLTYENWALGPVQTILDWLLFLGLVFVWSWLAPTIVGIVLHALNLAFYAIQVYRHGSPIQHVSDDFE